MLRSVSRRFAAAEHVVEINLREGAGVGGNEVVEDDVAASAHRVLARHRRHRKPHSPSKFHSGRASSAKAAWASPRLSAGRTCGGRVLSALLNLSTSRRALLLKKKFTCSARLMSSPFV